MTSKKTKKKVNFLRIAFLGIFIFIGIGTIVTICDVASKFGSEISKTQQEIYADYIANSNIVECRVANGDGIDRVVLNVLTNEGIRNSVDYKKVAFYTAKLNNIGGNEYLQPGQILKIPVPKH